MNKLITRHYQQQIITFELGNSCWVNLTEMAKANGKLVADWVRLQATSEYLEEYSSVMGIPITEILIIKQGGTEQGTWATQDVALEFARWCSPKFAVWCNMQIKELFTAGTVSLSAPNYEQALAVLGIAPEVIPALAPVFYQRDEAIRTKAEIGTRREATAMQTASAATRKATNLEVELDKSREWATVLKVQQVTGLKYEWKPLKNYMVAHDIPLKKVDSGMSRFAEVNTYHADAWHNVYNIDITEFKA